jgi:hypothetical protein
MNPRTENLIAHFVSGKRENKNAHGKQQDKQQN